MKTLNLSVRNLARQKRRSATVIAAIAFCFGISLALGSMARGTTISSFSYMAQLMGGHIFVSLEHREGEGDDSTLVSLIKDPAPLVSLLGEIGYQAKDITVRSEFYGDAYVPNSNEPPLFAALMGLGDKDLELMLGKLVIQNQRDPARIDLSSGRHAVISNATADSHKLGIGDEFQVVGTTVRGRRTVESYIVEAIYEAQSPWEGSRVYLPQFAVNKALAIDPESCTTLYVNLEASDQIAPALEVINRKLSEHYVTNTENRVNIFNNTIMRNDIVADDSVFQEFSGERFVLDSLLAGGGGGVIVSATDFMRMGALVILALILLVTVIGLNNNFRMIILERTREIGTMRAVGMQRSDVAKLFLGESVVLFGISMVLGMAFGGLLIAVASAIPLEVPEYTKMLFLGGHIHFAFDPVFFTFTTLLIAGSVFASVLVPANAAASIAPAEALRESH